MAEYIEKNHFDERIRIAVGMAEGDFTEDFKDGVLFVLSLLKSEKPADVVEREKIDKAIEEMKALANPENTILGFDEKMGLMTAMNILVRNIGE